MSVQAVQEAQVQSAKGGNDMRDRLRLMLGVAVAATMALSAGRAHAEDPNAAPNPYRAVESWAKLPEGRGGGQAIGVDIDRDGNVWVTDGRGGNGKGHTVIKFSSDGKVLMTLGKPGVAGEGPETFNGPSGVLVAPNGDIFVADGHGEKTNARIVKFSKDGKFIKTWGKAGKGQGEFDVPHALAMDSNGRLFVADRSNDRIQIFDQDGKFLAEWRQFGRPSGLYIDRNDILYAADSQSGEKFNMSFRQGIRIG